MTDAPSVAQIEAVLMDFGIGNPAGHDGLRKRCAQRIFDLCAAQSLTGCLHPGNEPLSCQHEGQCLSVSCDHHGKTKFPSFAERNLIDQFGRKETKT